MASIPEVWILNLQIETIEVHSEPGPNGYRKTVRYARLERVEPATLPDLAFDMDGVLPPREPEKG